jgi:hypothetical protein
MSRPSHEFTKKRSAIPSSGQVVDRLRRWLGLLDKETAELYCVQAFAGILHCPLRWIEAPTSLESVVIGSATPGGASR